MGSTKRSVRPQNRLQQSRQRGRAPGRRAVLTADASERFADRGMFGIEGLSGDTTGPRYGCHTASQGGHCVAFTGRGKIGTHDLGCRRHGREPMFLTPCPEIGEVTGVGAERRWCIGGVLVCLRLGQGHSRTRRRRLGAVQAGELALARVGEWICHGQHVARL